VQIEFWDIKRYIRRKGCQWPYNSAFTENFDHNHLLLSEYHARKRLLCRFIGESVVWKHLIYKLRKHVERVLCEKRSFHTRNLVGVEK
jgi:hypothetical protein